MVNCRICNSKFKKLVYQKYGFDIVRCKNCDLVFTDFNPSQKFLKDYYSKNYFVGGNNKLGYDDYGLEEASSRLTATKRIKIIRIAKKGKVLDIGCAYGFFLDEMPEGWEKYGLEISNFAYKKAVRINPDAKIQNKILSSNVFSTQKFDLITLWDVIEHLKKPKDELSIIYNKLKKGGKLAISTGDVNSLFSKVQRQGWHLYTPPQHLSFFSPDSIKKLLSPIGFKNISISHPAAYYPVSYLAHKLQSVYGINLPRISFIENIILPVNLGDIMLVVASK